MVRASSSLPKRLVDHRLMLAKRTEPLRLLFILGGCSKIASLAVKHASHMMRIRAVRAEGNRLLARWL
jgi:hypothetical protein